MLAKEVKKLTDQMESFTEGTFVVPGTGRTAIEIAGEHDTLFENQKTINGKLDKTIDVVDRAIVLLEGKPIHSPVTKEVTGHEMGLAAKVDYFYDAINGGQAMRWKREWTGVQRWVIGLFAGLLTGIFLLFLTHVLV